MTTDPMSIEYSQNVPATAVGYLRPAERFASFADYAGSTASFPQPAATSLDVARFHAFTGELTFAVDPAVRLYLDAGSVYHAERDGGPPLSRILLDAGVVDAVQLRRGIVSVGDVEHLGRLFDRVPTIDRDVVMVVIERTTEELVQQLANSVIATVTGLAYRHHPSGIHRWFVAPIERFAVHRPSTGVMQIDRSVVEELPQPVPPSARSEQPLVERNHDSTGESGRGDESVDDAVYIEWAEPDLSNPGEPVVADDLEPPTFDDHDHTLDLDVPDHDANHDANHDHDDGQDHNHDQDHDHEAVDIEADIEAELDSFDADRADWATTPSVDDPVTSVTAPASLGEFRIVWPDGTRDESIIAANGVPVEQPGATDDAVATEDAVSTDRAVSADGQTSDGAPSDVDPPIDRALPAPSFTDGTGARIQPVQLDWFPEPDAAVPDDVASVVRRALRAIESAGTHPVNPDSVVSPALAPAETARVEPLGFAPPSLQTRADAVPERTSAEDDFWALTEGIGGDVRAGHHAPADTSAVDDVDGRDVDGRDADDKSERRSALRRLIGSLRSKD